MLPKLLIAVTCLYVAKASVAPSIFDDEDTSNLEELSRTARSCGFTECNSFCRKLGHARGVCIGTYCQCRFRRRRSLDQEAAIEYAIEDDKSPMSNEEKLLQDHIVSEFETFVAVVGEGSPEDASDENTSVRSCENTECNNFCRKMGYARGVCIGTYCQCRYRMGPLNPFSFFQGESVDDNVRGTEEEPSTARYLQVAPLDEADHDRFVREARSCGYTECNNHCRKLGHARGVCIGTYCQCRSRLARSVKSEDDNGIVDNRIPTHAFLVEDGAVSDELEGSFEDCKKQQCELYCRRIGIPGGSCSNGRCRCDIPHSVLPAVPFADVSDNIDSHISGNDEDEVPSSVLEARSNDCNLRWCEQNCRRIGFPGGACVNGRCKCDIMRSEVPVVPAPLANFADVGAPQSRAVRRCTIGGCALICRRLGFRFSRCSYGRCLCWR